MATANSLVAVNSTFAALRKKYHRSVSIYVALTITTFLIVAATLILSVYAAGVSNANAKALFIGIAVVTAIIALLNGLISTFTFGQVARKAKGKITNIQAEEAAFNANDGEYAKLEDAKTKLEAFVRRTTAIYNS